MVAWIMLASKIGEELNSMSDITGDVIACKVRQQQANKTQLTQSDKTKPAHAMAACWQLQPVHDQLMPWPPIGNYNQSMSGRGQCNSAHGQLSAITTST